MSKEEISDVKILGCLKRKCLRKRKMCNTKTDSYYRILLRLNKSICHKFFF